MASRPVDDGQIGAPLLRRENGGTPTSGGTQHQGSGAGNCSSRRSCRPRPHDITSLLHPPCWRGSHQPASAICDGDHLRSPAAWEARDSRWRRPQPAVCQQANALSSRGRRHTHRASAAASPYPESCALAPRNTTEPQQHLSSRITPGSKDSADADAARSRSRCAARHRRSPGGLSVRERHATVP